MSFVQFFVPGIPQGQGSKAVNRATGGMYETNKKLLPWRSEIVACAKVAMQDRDPYLGPVRIQLTAVFPRPKGHYGSGRNEHLLKDSAPRFHTQKPDADKLARAVLDALTIAHVWHDDAQAQFVSIQKNWGGGAYTPGMHIFVQDAIDGAAAAADLRVDVDEPARGSCSHALVVDRICQTCGEDLAAEVAERLI